jgi:predicted RNA binding protein YcfA (HicA-like mRNA interferase family)
MTAKQVMDKLKANGWALDRINGSHHVFVKAGRRPNKDIGHLAKKILNEAGIE